MTMRRVPIPFGKVPTELVDEAVQAIREGKVVALPTETVYGLAADPADPASSERIRALKERPADLVFTHHIASAADLAAFAPAVPKRVQQLCDRYWPGPLTMVVPTGEGESVGLRVPSDDFTTAVIRAFGSSLYLTSVNRSGEPPLTSPDEIEAEFGDRIDLLYDVGDPPLRQASTVVRWIPSTVDPELGELEILREGTLTAEDLHGTTSRRFLFVCTGNTCRSPLAEALARRAAARRLGTSDARVAAHGLVFESAGVAAWPGEPASEGSAASAAEVDLSLEDHTTSALTAERLRAAERVFCLGPSHLVAARAMLPAGADKIELLDPSGAGIPDPFGHDLEAYRRTREAIARAVDARLAELIPDPE
jgi:tRNA threonylcarbamoyl adenosine modification protein (Sua5/YciO/YrdC/YwlC family)